MLCNQVHVWHVPHLAKHWIRPCSRSSSTSTTTAAAVTKYNSFTGKPQPSQSPEISTQCRSYCGVSSAFRSRWSHVADWKSSASLTSKIRSGAVGSTVLDRIKMRITILNPSGATVL
ncbi:aconitase 3 [Artemisia annua]|uniref:Aconitase 3 n=1 Tax=Artemisia annua TaxID=35608 RepID=A0A2U1KQL7_ARTAN|nr:aconitase 3 [Artemisia annua]